MRQNSNFKTWPLSLLFLALEAGHTVAPHVRAPGVDQAAVHQGAASGDGLKTDASTEFLGYEGTEASSEIVALFRDGESVNELTTGDDGAVVLASTPFYAESGGQIGDQGILVDDGKLFRVDDTQKSGDANVHFGTVEQGALKVGDALEAIVTTVNRVSAIFEREDMTLHEAQLHRLDTICRKLDLQPEDHLLEIGTGWGGLAIHAARHFGCRVTTTTISREQHRMAQERIAAAGLEDRVTLLLEDYRDLDGRYDKLVSIEMIEAIDHGVGKILDIDEGESCVTRTENRDQASAHQAEEGEHLRVSRSVDRRRADDSNVHMAFGGLEYPFLSGPFAGRVRRNPGLSGGQ